jgi:Icc-related predicted phosphoesterase
MRLAVISDIHGSTGKVKRFSMDVEKFSLDIVVIAGDITNFGGKKEAREILSAIPFRKIAVPGNCDPPEIVDVFEETDTVDVHGKRAEVNGHVFAGLGASNPLPFNTLFTYSEENIHLILDSVARGAEVIVTHTPPYGILDRTMFGHHGGSEAIRKVIDEHTPRLSVFGHIHESPGIERNEHTLFVNPGPLKNGNYAIVDMGENDIRAERRHLSEK